MKNAHLKLYSLAKLNSLEILIEERIQYVGSSQSRFFENYIKNQKILKRKVLITKIFSSVIFSILPLIPLLTYFQIDEILIEENYSIDIIVFVGNLLFTLYILLQSLNFLLLGMFSTSLIISGRIFRWYETFPISRDKLKKIVYLTIFRTLDLPIIVSIFAFPIIFLVGTLNIMMFFVCLGISFLNCLFSFSTLIYISERINRILDINEIGSKKTHGIRLFNMFSYLAIITISVYTIQWVIGSLGFFFDWFTNMENSSLLNLILSVIIYPFTPGYVISLFISPSGVPLELWITTFLGLGILILLTIRIYNKALDNLEKTTYSKYKSDKKNFISFYGRKKQKFNLKVVSPVNAFIRKDLLTASRDIKTFMSMIMPIVLSFVFRFSFNLSLLGISVPIESKLIYDWMVIIGFNVILGATIIYNLINIEESGETILSSLPINPRDQAKAKLILMLILQTVSVISPNLMYIMDPRFFSYLITSIATIPFIWMFLFLMFEMRIYYFGKINNRYIIGDIVAENKLFKWILIFLANYFFYYWLMVFTINLYYLDDLNNLLGILTTILTISFFLVASIFNSMFPKKLNEYFNEEKVKKNGISKIGKDGTPTWFTKHIWISIFLLIILFYIFTIISSFMMPFYDLFYPEYQYSMSHEISKIAYLMVFNLTFMFFFFLVPRIIGLPRGKQSFPSYLNNIGIGWLYKTFKIVMVGILFLVVFMILYFIIFGIFLYPQNIDYLFYFNSSLFFLIFNISMYFWFEILIRGIIFTMLLTKYSEKKSLVLNAIIHVIIYQLPNLFSYFYIERNPFYYLLNLIYTFIIGLIFAFIFLKSKNILPGMTVLILTNVLGISIFF